VYNTNYCTDGSLCIGSFNKWVIMRRYDSGGSPPGYDRTRGALPGNRGFKLTYLEEAYTTEHWLVRIYRSAASLLLQHSCTANDASALSSGVEPAHFRPKAGPAREGKVESEFTTKCRYTRCRFAKNCFSKSQ
jgi:hypothetical protein